VTGAHLMMGPLGLIRSSVGVLGQPGCHPFEAGTGRMLDEASVQGAVTRTPALCAGESYWGKRGPVQSVEQID